MKPKPFRPPPADLCRRAAGYCLFMGGARTPHELLKWAFLAKCAILRASRTLPHPKPPQKR